MGRSEHHVVWNSEEGTWDVKREHAERVSGRFDNKEEAVDYGRQVSINQNTELIIHRKDGRIQNSDSHGHDPCPPKDMH